MKSKNTQALLKKILFTYYHVNPLFYVLHKQTIKKTVSEINNNRTKRSGNTSQ